MIRTTLSFCVFFGSLLLVSKWLHESNRSHARNFEMPSRTLALPPAELAPLSAPIETSSPAELEAPIQLTAYEDPTLAALLEDIRSEAANLPGKSEPVAEQGRVKEHLSDPAEQQAKDASPNSPPAEAAKTSEPAAAPAAPAKETEIVLTAELLALRERMRECLAYYYFRPENVAIRSPWGAMHAMIAYGVDSELIAGDKRVNAIGYLCYNGTCNSLQLFYTSNKKLQTRIGPGVQGHPGQFLAMLAQSKVKSDFPMKVDGRDFTVADLIEHEKETCRPRTELTFKLIAFTHYLKSDEKWKSNDGQEWDIPRVIKEELAQPIVGAACGGTHRMTGFSYAMRKREARGEKFEGQWLRAKKFVEDYHEYAFRLQNSDGSFSTDFFAGRADFGPNSKRLETTGHITEWLAYSLNKEQLVEPRMLKSVEYLTTLLLENRNEKWGIGPLGHGLHALAMFDERIFGGKPGTRAVELAEVRKSKAAAR